MNRWVDDYALVYGIGQETPEQCAWTDDDGSRHQVPVRLLRVGERRCLTVKYGETCARLNNHRGVHIPLEDHWITAGHVIAT